MKRALIYIFFFLFFWGWWTLLYIPKGDDYDFAKMFLQYNFGDFMVHRYNTWSSRVFIEPFVYFFSLKPIWIWAVFCSFCLCGIMFTFDYLLDNKKAMISCLSGLLILSVPNVFFNNAGWKTTTLFYWFPFFLLLVAMGSVYDYYKQNKISMLKSVSYMLATLIAANNEQCCIILGGLLVVAPGYFYYERKGIYPLLCGQLACLVINVALFFFCPGNFKRYDSEINSWLPEYPSWNIFEKVGHGVTHFFDVFFAYSYCSSLLMLICVLGTLISFIYKKNKDALVVLATALCFWGCILWISLSNNILVTKGNVLDFEYLLSVGLVLCVCYTLYLLFENTMPFYISLLIMTLGAISVILLCFSPTLYASGERLYLYFIYGLLGIIVYIFSQYNEKVVFLKYLLFLFGGYWVYSEYRVVFDFLSQFLV